MPVSKARDIATSIGRAVIADTISSTGTISSSASFTVYDSAGALPSSGVDAGSQAYVSSNQRLYIRGSGGWYSIATVNNTPVISSVVDANSNSSPFSLATDGTATTITITATDSEGFPITYTATADSDFNGLASVTSDSSVFTITPFSEDSATTTSGTLTFKASDGVNIASELTTFILIFRVANSNATTLLVKASGNSGTNTSITDSSTNSHTVTVNGNTQATSFSPYRYGGYSYYFDASAVKELTFSLSSGGLGSGDFTVECWVYPTGVGSTRSFIFDSRGTSTSGGLAIAIETDYAIDLYKDDLILASTATVVPDTWNHVAVVRSSGTIYIYVDGMLRDSVANTTNFSSVATTIGNWGGGTSATAYALVGYLSDLRAVKGTAVYTSDFTPPDKRLTAITNTELLTCHLPYVADGSSNGHSITITGNVSSKPFAPYDYQKYSASTHGGSIYFNGTSDYMTIPADTTNLTLDGDFTIDFWVYPTSAFTNEYIYGKWNNNSDGWLVMITTDWSSGNFGSLSFYYGNYGSNESATSIRTEKIKQNQWNHCRITRESGVFYMAINGVVGTRSNYGANGLSWSDTRTFNANTTIGIGGQTNYKYGSGYISNLVVIKGTALTTTNFTSPTSPLSSSGTALYIKGTDAKVYDASQSSGTLTLVGNAASSTTQTKYASSVYFDGTGDYITAQMDDFIISEDEDWTVEFWAYISNVSADNAFVIFGPTDSGTGAAKVGFGIFESGTKLAIIDFSTASNNKNLFGNSTQLSSNTWHHIAFVKSGNQVAVFIDGTIDSAGWVTFASNITLSNRARAHIGGVYNLFLNGYLEDVRITKGLARYPFIPAKETVTAGANTQFLTAHAATITDGSGNSHSITTAGDVAVSSTIIPASGMYSIAFDGTGDYLRADTALDFHSSTSSAFTIECWVNPSVLGGTGASTDDFIGINRASDGLNVLVFSPVQIRWNNADVTGVTDMSTGRWYHVALVYDGSTARYFIDGRLDTTLSGSIGTALADCTLLIGAEADAANAGSIGNYFSGYISNLVISNSEVYTANFTPPTSELLG